MVDRRSETDSGIGIPVIGEGRRRHLPFHLRIRIAWRLCRIDEPTTFADCAVVRHHDIAESTYTESVGIYQIRIDRHLGTKIISAATILPS
jgi:hypothetical protein